MFLLSPERNPEGSSSGRLPATTRRIVTTIQMYNAFHKENIQEVYYPHESRCPIKRQDPIPDTNDPVGTHSGIIPHLPAQPKMLNISMASFIGNRDNGFIHR